MPRAYRKKLPAKKTTLTKKARDEVKAIAKRVVHVAEPLHYIDEYSTGTTITSTATFINLTDAITQGDTQTSRSGDVVKLAKMRFHGTFNRLSGTSAALDFDHIRMVLFKWMPSTADETPTEAGLLYDSSADDINAPIELDPAEARKFRILEDRRILLGARPTSVGPVNSNIPIAKDFSIRKYGKQLGRVLFEANTSTASGHIYLMLIGLQTGGDASSIRYHCTFHFDP